MKLDADTNEEDYWSMTIDFGQENRLTFKYHKVESHQNGDLLLRNTVTQSVFRVRESGRVDVSQGGHTIVDTHLPKSRVKEAMDVIKDKHRLE